MLNRSPLWITAIAAVALGLSACGGGSDTKAKTPSSSTTSPTTQPTAAEPAPRTVAKLTSALIELGDLPSGFAIVPASGRDDDGSVASTDPKCAPLVTLINVDRPPGSKASAKVSFSGGQDGPFVEESIDALGSADAVKALQDSFKSAVAACHQLVMTIPGQGSSTMSVAEVSAPQFGDHPVAARMTATGGAMTGLEITQVTAGVRDVVVALTLVAAAPEDVDGATQAALGKAAQVLGAA